MKATLEFNLPEEREDFELVQRAPDYFCILNEFENWMRSIAKHGDPKVDKIHRGSLQIIRDKYLEIKGECLE